MRRLLVLITVCVILGVIISLRPNLSRQERSNFRTFFRLSVIPVIITLMIELTIPGRNSQNETLRIEHLVMDVNGTLAVDGFLLEGVAKRIGALRDRLNVHLLTADTHGRQAVIDHLLNLQAVRIERGREAEQKAEYVRKLGTETVAAIGQGANDALMVREAALGICVMSVEGLAVETLNHADLLLPDILNALDLFDRPLRLIASLRK